MRLGGPVEEFDSPETWVRAVGAKGYRAAYCPVGPQADADTVQAYAAAAREADIVIAEVGAWSNPISPDEGLRNEALDKCKRALKLADEIGARCCVNVSGSRSENWAGPGKDDLTDETFDLIVESVREIHDAVRPTRTFYTLEAMAWAYPDSVESYQRLLAAIDRPGVAVHFDPTNLINCPWRYFNTGKVITEFVERLGPRIRSCHAKDVRLETHLTMLLPEVRAGLGGLDYRAFLSAVDAIDPDMPLLLEHLATMAEYDLAAEHIRTVAAEVNVLL